MCNSVCMQEQPVGVASPTTVRKDKLHKTFKLAKIQVSGRQLCSWHDECVLPRLQPALPA